ncbi:MAG: bacteriohemerythrin [Pseudomonadota bacterium]
MSLFIWSDDLSVGSEFIDHDHKKLIKLVNDFHDALEQGRGNEVIGKVLRNLIIYTRDHFAREEDEMKRIAYPRMSNHVREHEQLLAQVDQLERNFEAGSAMLSIKVSRFLRDWLVDHIHKTDRLFADAIRHADEGRALAAG